MKTFLRRLGAIALLAVTLGATVGAAQAAPRSFAVLSELAREVQVVTQDDVAAGSIVSKLPATQGAFDKLVLVTARDAIRDIDKGAPIWLLEPPETDIFDARGSFLVGDVVPLPADLVAGLKQHGSTHLLLFTRYRTVASTISQGLQLGTGSLEGLGYFVDKQTPMRNALTGVTSVGFLAPYIHFRATLIDAGTGQVLAMRRIERNVILPPQRAEDSGNPWNILNSTEKVQKLTDLVIDQVDKVVAELLKAQ